jgi:hypothetical protein
MKNPKKTTSESELSRLLNLDRRTVSKELSAAGLKRQPGGFDTAEALKVLAKCATGLDAKRRVEIKRLELVCERIAFDNEVRKGLFIPLAEVTRDAARAILACKFAMYGNLDADTSSAVMKLGLNDEQAEQLRAILKRSLDAALRNLTLGNWGKPPCPHCGKEIAP